MRHPFTGGPLLERSEPRAPVTRGEKIRDRRMAAGLTLGECARAAGISVVALSEIELDRPYASESAVRAVETVLGWRAGSPEGAP